MQSWNVTVTAFAAVAALCGCAQVTPFDNGLTGGRADMAAVAAPADLAMRRAPDLAMRGDLAMATPDDLAATDDLAMPPDDLATPPDLAMPPDLATPPDMARPRDLAMPPDLTTSSCHIVVNEVQTGTTATGTEEFVEIFNPCASTVTTTGYKLVYRSANNTNPRSGADTASLYSLPSMMTSGAYLVIGGSGFKGTADGTLASGLAANGAVGIRDGAGNLVDSVGYGSVAGNTFVETAAAPLPPVLASPGGSIERIPNGADTDDNSHDFVAANSATPGAANR